MSDSEFEQRLDRVTRAAEAVKNIGSSELQAEAFRYLIGSTGAVKQDAPVSSTTDATPERQESGDTNEGNGTAGTTNGKKQQQRKNKPAGVAPDKTLELAPSGKQSFLEFAAEKKPASHIERYTVCVYWILEVANQTKATVAQIVTCYHAAKWSLPTDVRNTASQAGMKELDNTDGLENIKLSNLGRNLVLNLPRAEKK